jgi:catechol 2,3-dioxygenase-like lactoylglutathione lyase family enzyme
VRILGIDHIGIASGDLGKHIEIFGDKLGLEIHDIEEKDPYGGLRAAFARIGDTDFEILEDRVPDGDQKVIDQRDIAKFVALRAGKASTTSRSASPTSKRRCETPAPRGST